MRDLSFRTLAIFVACAVTTVAVPAAGLLGQPIIASCNDFACSDIDWRSVCQVACVHVIQGSHAFEPTGKVEGLEGLGELFLDGDRVDFCGFDIVAGEHDCDTIELYLEPGRRCHRVVAWTTIQFVGGGMSEPAEKAASRGCG